jgi:hypothetical protein
VDATTLPRRLTIEGVQESNNSLTLTVEQFERHIKDLINRLETRFKAVTTSEEDLMVLLRLRKERNSSRESFEICIKALMYMK